MAGSGEAGLARNILLSAAIAPGHGSSSACGCARHTNNVRRCGTRPPPIVTPPRAIGCSVAIMGLRDGEVQAISSGLTQRIVESDEDPFRVMGLLAREGSGAWSFARSRCRDNTVRTGYVLVYFDGVAWVTAESLAKHPSRWGNNDTLIPTDSIVSARVSLPRGAPTPTSWSRVQVLSPGQAACCVATTESTYQFTHLENPFAFEVAQELDGQLTGERGRASPPQTLPATNSGASAQQPGNGDAAVKESARPGRQGGVAPGDREPANPLGSNSHQRLAPSLAPVIRVAAVAVAAMLLLGTALVLPYDYYTVLRVVVCAFACALLWLLGNPLAQPAESQLWSLAASGGLVATALLFNPVVPVALKRETWAPIDIATVFGLLTVSFLLTRQGGSLGRVSPGA